MNTSQKAFAKFIDDLEIALYGNSEIRHPDLLLIRAQELADLEKNVKGVIAYADDIKKRILD